MIEITIARNGKVFEVTAKGHSGYAPEGEDIVCSGVTSVMLFAANAAICTDGKLLKMESGEIGVTIPVREETELIIEALKMTFDTMRIRYGEWIKISAVGV